MDRQALQATMARVAVRADPKQSAPPTDNSNIRLLIIAAAFLVVTIGLIFMQPDGGKLPAQAVSTAAFEALPDVQPSVAPVQEEGDVVTRAEASMLSDPEPAQIEPPNIAQPLPHGGDIAREITRRLRAPLRATSGGDAIVQAPLTERGAVSVALSIFDSDESRTSQLRALTVQALTEGRSDAYIDALINTAYARGDILVPNALMAVSGRVDTQALLWAVLSQIGTDEAKPIPVLHADHAHVLAWNDSLAGLALQYYREPSAFDGIARSNGVVSLADGLRPGVSLTIPTL